MSLPLRECGLKSHLSAHRGHTRDVTPFAGVWIEMPYGKMDGGEFNVTPFAGVWIEISIIFVTVSDLPVTPFAGVWIEMV